MSVSLVINFKHPWFVLEILMGFWFRLDPFHPECILRARPPKHSPLKYSRVDVHRELVGKLPCVCLVADEVCLCFIPCMLASDLQPVHFLALVLCLCASISLPVCVKHHAGFSMTHTHKNNCSSYFVGAANSIVHVGLEC